MHVLYAYTFTTLHKNEDLVRSRRLVTDSCNRIGLLRDQILVALLHSLQNHGDLILEPRLERSKPARSRERHAAEQRLATGIIIRDFVLIAASGSSMLTRIE